MHKSLFAVSIVVATSILWVGRLSGQTDTIGGVINRYTRLTFIECTNNSAIIVENPYGFKVGDRILIIQMKGAVIDKSNTSSFGTITAYDNAGNYELATIDEIHGKSFVLKYQLARTYTLSGIVQVIRVPTYTNVVVNSLLRAQAWNGSTGGVLAFLATGTVTLNANIDVRGQGFRGMADRWPNMTSTDIQPLATEGPGNPSGSLHYYSLLQRWDSGGVKGEGIHEGEDYYMAARGKLANGGGGGISSQSGGGGGGNAGAGGTGGMEASGVANGGIGGVALPYSNTDNRVFLGGSGGWGGPSLIARGYGGESGGGIILIQADEIVGNSYSIIANGNNVILDPGEPIAGEGGGAGGVVLLDVNQYSDTLSVQAVGGNGGDYPNCFGPGGGGGGGCVWVKGGTLPPATVTIAVNGGSAGNGTPCTIPGLDDDAISSASPPPVPNYGADDGANGVKLTGLQIPVSTTPR